MAIGFFTVLLATVGIIFGAMRKNKLMVRISVIMLMLVIAVWIYFYNNPY